MDLAEVEARLDTVLVSAHGWIPDGELAQMRRLVQVGEPGIALENFCTQLYEYDVAVPGETARELGILARAMGLKLPAWLEGVSQA
jgi:hypothetical protein